MIKFQVTGIMQSIDIIIGRDGYNNNNIMC